MRGQGFKAARRLVLLALLPALAAPMFLDAAARVKAQGRPSAVKARPQTPVQTDAPATVNGTRIQATSVTKVNFKQLADLAKRAGSRLPETPTLRPAPVPGTIDDTPPDAAAPAGSDALVAPAPTAGLDDTGGPNVASPSPSQSFLAQEDGPKVGTGTFNIPPDTNGAVGLDRIFTNTNSNYRVQNKATGAAISTVSADTFWAPSGASGFFDPQIVFDPYNQRWILAMATNSSSANSSMVIAVSQTSDPAGSYNMYRFIVGCAGGTTGCNAQGEWADFPMIGFNQNWIAVGMNMFQIVGTGAGGAQQNNNDKTLIVDYPSARAGSSVATLFSDIAIGFCNYPVSTYSATENTLYLAQHLSSGGATYKISTITGTPGTPVFTLGATRTRPGGGWTQPGGDLAPQICIPGVSIPTQTCPATARRIDVGDAQVRSNPVFRNGRIWYSQTIALPTGGLTTNSRVVAQWTSVDTTGVFVDGGRVEDATATITNGGKNYGYPSLAVNKNSDVLMGFSEFESDDYADAGYTFRLGTDAAGTMRDPVIYKEGEDYYEKTFGGTRNRWGDYSHTLIDPVNDRDMWTVQEYAQARVGATGQGSNDSRWGTWWAKVSAPAGAGDLIISEFRVRGPNPNGAQNEFVELYNNNESPLTVTTADGSAGYAVAASDGVIRCTIPTGTVIPARGHYLCVNSVGYSLSNYPAGNGTTATGDATYTTDIADNAGIALFNTADVAAFSTATRLDAAGSTSEVNTLYKEGTGYAALTPFSIDYSFYRDTCGKGGSITTLGGCPTGGFLVDTNNNAADFIFGDTNGTNAGSGQRLGAPGPKNLSSPVQRNSQIAGGNIDPAVGASSPPNRIRDFTSDPANNSTFGTLLIRKTLTNNTGANVTRLRFRVIDQTTFPAPSGFADLRTRTSSTQVVAISGTNPACPANTCTVLGTTMEQPPSQLNGGAFNTTLSAGTVTLATPVAPGGQLNVQFLLGIQQTGTFKFFVNLEVLTGAVPPPPLGAETSAQPSDKLRGRITEAQTPSAVPQSQASPQTQDGSQFTPQAGWVTFYPQPEPEKRPAAKKKDAGNEEDDREGAERSMQ